MNKEKGNALFLILIAVALFAALSYAVTQSGRGGSGIDKEQASLIAAEITQYGSTIEQAVLRMRLINGCSETEISFHYDSDGDGTLETDGSDNYYNPNSPTDFSCHVFQPVGGGLTYRQPDSSWLDGTSTSANDYGELFFSGRVCIPDIGTGGQSCTTDGSDPLQEELLMFVPFLEEAVCLELARNFDVQTSSGAIPFDSGNLFTSSNSHHFTGTYADGTRLNNDGSLDNERTIRGKPVGCVQSEANPLLDSFHYFHVLIAR